MRTFTLSAALILGTLGAAYADGHSAPPQIAARNGLMANYAFNLGILGDMAKGATDYNAEVAAVAAANLAAVSGTDQSLLWAEGTDNASIQGTRAAPAIWSDMAGFKKATDDMAMAAAAMASAAGTDLAALQGAMGGVGASCGACHKAYRGPK